MRPAGPASARHDWGRGAGSAARPQTTRSPGQEEQHGGVVLSTLVAAIDVPVPVTQTLSVSAGSRKSYAARRVCGSAGVVAICLSSSTLLVVFLSSSLPRSSPLPFPLGRNRHACPSHLLETPRSRVCESGLAVGITCPGRRHRLPAFRSSNWGWESASRCHTGGDAVGDVKTRPPSVSQSANDRRLTSPLWMTGGDTGRLTRSRLSSAWCRSPSSPARVRTRGVITESVCWGITTRQTRHHPEGSPRLIDAASWVRRLSTRWTSYPIEYLSASRPRTPDAEVQRARPPITIDESTGNIRAAPLQLHPQRARCRHLVKRPTEN